MKLPQPSPDARSYSDALTHRIANEIETAGGWIGFDRFMELALYAPGMDAEAFARGIRSLDDPETRASVIAAGTAHIARFSWEHSADVLLDALAALPVR